MLMKKLTAFLAAAVLMLSVISTPVFAEQDDEFVMQRLGFGSFTGIIVEISEYHGDETKSFMYMENEEGQIVTFIVSPDTFCEVDLEAGMEVTGYYDMSLPVLMIYPPQYQAKAIIAAADETEEPSFVKVDRFDENLLSYDGELKLNISAETNITFPDGVPFTIYDAVPTAEILASQLADRALVVFYEVTTRSIPPQTSPSRIVVLFETEVAAAPEVTEPSSSQASELIFSEVIVSGETIGEQAIFIASSGMPLVPLRVICEALELTVEWNEDSKSVIIDGGYALKIGEDTYLANDTATNLGQEPIIIDDRTYVPLNFFREVLGMNNAFFFEGQITIDNFEKFE